MNMITPEMTINGPGRTLVADEATMPAVAATAPKMALKIEYRVRFPLMMRAAAAGVTTRKPTSNVPVT